MVETVAFITKKDGALNALAYNADVEYIPLGTIAQLRSQLTTFFDASLDDAYLKARVVGAGTRLFRTSQTESQSGTQDVIYAQDGAAFSSGVPIVRDLARPRRDRMRSTLWGECGCIRNKTGFVS